MQGIYMIKNTENNKVYIGSSATIENRWKQHIEMLQSHCHHSSRLQEDYNKYGITKFIFTVLQLTTNTNKLLSYEQKWVDKYKCYLAEKGYNILSVVDTNIIEKNDCNIGLIEVCNYYKTVTNQQRDYLKDNLNITSLMDFAWDKYKKILDGTYIFTKKWYGKDIENRKMTRKMILNYLNNILRCKSSSIYWSTFVTYQRELQAKGYTKSHLTLDAQPDEKRNNLVFAMNLYPNSFIKQNITENISNEEYALSLLLKWILNVTDITKPINIFIPSMRMYKLLNDWLNEEVK